MAEEELLFDNRAWFVDARSPFRRMGVTSHPEAGIVVVSLWVGDTCTATFQVKMDSAGRLISELADGLARSVPDHPSQLRPVE